MAVAAPAVESPGPGTPVGSAGEAAPRRGARWPGLDGLRGVAVLLVVFYHFHMPGRTLRHLVGGWCGVDLFFVLSGFLITNLLINERERRGTISFRAFYRRRWRRLGPALVAMLVVGEVATVFLAWPGAPFIYPLSERARDLFSVVTLGYNWWGIAGVNTAPFLSALWSLAVEEQFYLVWPLVILLAYWRLPRPSARRLLAIVAVGGAAVSALECNLLYPSHLNQVRIYFGTDTRAQGLLVGAAAALLWSSGFRLSQVVSLGLAGLGALAICLVATQVRDANPFRVNGAFPLLAVSTALVLLNVVWEPGSLFARVLSWSPLRWAGRRSYAIYLWHAPIATFLYGTPTGLSGATRFGWAGFVGGVALSLVLAELSWRWLESRFQGAGRPARAAAPAATA